MINYNAMNLLKEKQDLIDWEKFFSNPKQKRDEIDFLKQTITNKTFWENLPKHFADTATMIKEQDFVDWNIYFQTFPQLSQIQELINNVENKQFWAHLPTSRYEELSPEVLTKLQYIIDWGKYLGYFDRQKIKSLIKTIDLDNRDFWTYLALHTDEIIPLEKQDTINWKKFFENSSQYSWCQSLCETITHEDFWFYLPKKYLQTRFTIEAYKEKQDLINWKRFFEPGFSETIVLELMQVINNKSFWENLPIKYKYNDEDYIKNQKEINWEEFFSTNRPSNELVQKLITIIDVKTFWQKLPAHYYTLDLLVRFQNKVEWENYFIYACYDEYEVNNSIVYLMGKITDENFWKHLPINYYYCL